MTDTQPTAHESTDERPGLAPTTRRTWLVLLTGSALGGNGTAMTVTEADGSDPDDVTVLSVHAYGEGGYGEGTYGGVEIVVETKDATGIGDTEATLVGDLIATGGNDDIDVSFAYDEADKTDLDQSIDAGELSEEAAFDAEVVDLDPDTEYEFRAVAEADGDTASGEIGSFQTLGEDQPQLCVYTNDDGVIQLAGVRSAINDWQDGTIKTDVLVDVIDQWAAGEPVEDCV